jgi:hypothetical protein
MGNCGTCSAITPGFVACDAVTGERIPDSTAPMDYAGMVGSTPCPECNQGRRAVLIAAPHLMGRETDRDGYPLVWTGSKDRPSWRPHLRGGKPVDQGRLKPIAVIKALLTQAGRKIAKQYELLPERGRKSPGI